MASDDKTDTADAGEVDPSVAAALTMRFGRTKKAAGREPDGLEEIALYVDGALPAERRAVVEARLQAEPELRAVVDELARLERVEPEKTEAEKPSNVIPLVIPGRSSRVGSIGLGAPGNLRSLPAPEKKNPLRFALMGIGAAFALAAILFLLTRPPAEVTGTQGAGIGGKPDGIAIGFEAGQAVLEVEAANPGELAVLVATPDGTRAVGLCDAKTCLVTNDRLALRTGKNTARAVIGDDNGQCAFVLALTANGPNPTSSRSAAYVDPHAAAKALGVVVSKDACVLESMDLLRSISGARHIAFMKVPAK